MKIRSVDDLSKAIMRAVEISNDMKAQVRALRDVERAILARVAELRREFDRLEKAADAFALAEWGDEGAPLWEALDEEDAHIYSREGALEAEGRPAAVSVVSTSRKVLRRMSGD